MGGSWGGRTQSGRRCHARGPAGAGEGAEAGRRAITWRCGLISMRRPLAREGVRTSVGVVRHGCGMVFRVRKSVVIGDFLTGD